MSRVTSLAALGLVALLGASCSSENTGDDDDNNAIESTGTGGRRGTTGTVISTGSGGTGQDTGDGTTTGVSTGTSVGGSTGSSSTSSGGTTTSTTRGGTTSTTATGGITSSTSSGGTTTSTTRGGTTSTTTAGGTTTSTGTGGRVTTSGGTGTAIGGASASGGDSGETGSGGTPTGCEYREATTKSSPAILQFVIDKSTSMNTVIGSTNGASKWEATRDALNSAYAGMDPSLCVGENFFPNATGGCVNTSGGVNPAPLTAVQVTALQSAVNAIPVPTNIAGTPTHDAWREGLRRLQAILAAPPAGYETAQGYLVLVTDGMPVRTLNCGQAAGDNTAVTEAQFDELINDVSATTAASGIKTFVIGVPGSEDTSQVPTDPSGSGLDYIPREKLSQLAQVGQTATGGCDNSGSPYYCHFDLVNSSDFAQGLQDAVASVVASTISCAYPIIVDQSSTDWFVDTDQMKVNYYSGGTPTELARTDCSTSTVGWQLSSDNWIDLCPDTCAAVQADPTAEIRIDYGCVTVQ